MKALTRFIENTDNKIAHIRASKMQAIPVIVKDINTVREGYDDIMKRYHIDFDISTGFRIWTDIDDQNKIVITLSDDDNGSITLEDQNTDSIDSLIDCIGIQRRKLGIGTFVNDKP